MTIYEFPYDGVADGDAVTEANSGHTAISTTRPVFHVDADGYTYIRFGVAAGQTWANQGFAAVNQVSRADVINLRTGASAAMEVWQARGTPGKLLNQLTSTADTLTVRGYGDATVSGAASTALTEGAAYLRQMAYDRAAGHLLYRITPLAGGAALVDYDGALTVSADQYTAEQWGDLGTSPTIIMDVGRVRIATGADALSGGSLALIDPYTATPATPAVYHSPDGTSLVAASLWHSSDGTTAGMVRVDVV